MYNDLFTIGPLTIHGYGLMIGLGVVCGLAWASRRARRRGLGDDMLLSLGLWGLLAGFLGAKALYVLTELPAFLRDPLSVLGSEGFVVYGGIALGLLVAWLYARRHGADAAAYLDVFMPPVALAQAFGRVGCFLAGCCFGKVTDAACGVVFPAGSAAPAGVALLPVQLFSTAGDLLLAGALLLLERRQKRTGVLGAAYLVLYGVGRFLIEFWRADPRGSVGALSTSQFISLLAIPAGALLWWYLHKKGREKT